MKDYIQIGIEKGLIFLNEDKSRIKYIWQKKERNYNDPEEKVQALAFLQLILDYYYPVSRIRLFCLPNVTSERWISNDEIKCSILEAFIACALFDFGSRD